MAEARTFAAGLEGANVALLRPHRTARSVEFAEFVLSQLPRPRARALEVGCGSDGGVAPALAEAGHDVLAIDPDAPEGPLYRQITLEQLDDPGPFDAVVAERVLHHIHPLPAALDKITALAPLLILDEFAWNHLDEPTVSWYESRHRQLAAAGREPKGPADLTDWRLSHSGLHSYETLRSEVNARYLERYVEWRPYLYRWLDDPGTQQLEQSLVAAGAIRPIGFRYVGSRLPARSNEAEH
jgi:Methyltransferase domain